MQRHAAPLSVVTSFFVVRGLAGALRLGAAALGAAQSSERFAERVARAVVDGAAGRVGGNDGARAEGDDGAAAVRAAAERQLEYLHCLRMNLRAPAVRRVLLLVQDAPSAALLSELAPRLRGDGAELVPVRFRPEAQPLYSDLFSLARDLLHPRWDIAAVCNSDIHFHTAQCARADAAYFARALPHAPRTALALTRYEEAGDSFHRGASASRAAPAVVSLGGDAPPAVDAQHAPLIDDFRGSHDAFVLRPGAISDDFIRAVQHPQNAFQAENIVVHELRARAGLRVRNPSRGAVMRVAHRHASDVRQWFPPAHDGSRYGSAEPEFDFD